MYHYFRLPEPAGRTFAEVSLSYSFQSSTANNIQLDILFERKIPARQFKHTEVNAFDVALQHKMYNESEDVLEASRA